MRNKFFLISKIMKKPIFVVIDGVELEKYKMNISKDTKIKDVKEKCIGFNILRLDLNGKDQLNVFNSSKYDNITFASVLDEMENATLYVSTLPKIISSPQVQSRRGKIRIAQQARARSYPEVKGFENIPCHSRGKGDWKQLSPFYLKFKEGAIFENFFQSFKVFEKVYEQNTKNWTWQAETHVDKDKNPNPAWLKWHNALLHHDLPVRRPNGKHIPLYSYWNGKKLGVIDSRKEIYIPYLKKLYRDNAIYKKLLGMLKSGVNLMLIEPDGPFIDLYPQGLEVDLTVLKHLIGVTNYGKEGISDKYRPYGHGYVLATCLLEDS